MGCVQLGEKNCVHLPNFTQSMASNNFGPSIQCHQELDFIDNMTIAAHTDQLKKIIEVVQDWKLQYR